MLLGREEVRRRGINMSAVEFQRMQWQLACRMHIGLQKLHVHRPSLVVLNSVAGRPAVSYGWLLEV
jgi:hypothetical protein